MINEETIKKFEEKIITILNMDSSSVFSEGRLIGEILVVEILKLENPSAFDTIKEKKQYPMLGIMLPYLKGKIAPEFYTQINNLKKYGNNYGHPGPDGFQSISNDDIQILKCLLKKFISVFYKYYLKKSLPDSIKEIFKRKEFQIEYDLPDISNEQRKILNNLSRNIPKCKYELENGLSSVKFVFTPILEECCTYILIEEEGLIEDKFKLNGGIRKLNLEKVNQRFHKNNYIKRLSCAHFQILINYSKVLTRRGAEKLDVPPEVKGAFIQFLRDVYKKYWYEHSPHIGTLLDVNPNQSITPNLGSNTLGEISIVNSNITFTLELGENKFGRRIPTKESIRMKNRIYDEKEEVSRNHFSIFVEKKGEQTEHFIMDNKSKNGTTLNGTHLKADEKVTLTHNSKIILAKNTIELVFKAY